MWTLSCCHSNRTCKFKDWLLICPLFYSIRSIYILEICIYSRAQATNSHRFTIMISVLVSQPHNLVSLMDASEPDFLSPGIKIWSGNKNMCWRWLLMFALSHELKRLRICSLIQNYTFTSFAFLCVRRKTSVTRTITLSFSLPLLTSALQWGRGLRNRTHYGPLWSFTGQRRGEGHFGATGKLFTVRRLEKECKVFHYWKKWVCKF